MADESLFSTPLSSSSKSKNKDLTKPLLVAVNQEESAKGSTSDVRIIHDLNQERNGDGDGNNDPSAEPLNDNDENMTSLSSSSSVVVSWFLMGTVTIATLPMLLFGYHTGVLNAPEAVIFPGHSVASWSAAVSAFCAGGMIGAPPTGKFADAIGRKRGIEIILVFNAVAGIAHVATPNMMVLIFARFAVGVAGGAATVLTPLYLSEISPPALRGSIGTLTQLACVVGILASALWEIPFDSTDHWRWIFVPIPVLSFLGLLFLAPVFLVESPKWLLFHNSSAERRQEAIQILKRLRGATAHGDDDGIIEMIMHDGDTNQDEISNYNATTTSEDDVEDQETTHRVFTAYHSFGHYIRDKQNFVPLVSALLFPIAQQLSGINAVFYYSTQLFRKAGMQNPQGATLLAFGVNVVATLAAMALMDRLGRKTLLSVSAGGMLLCCIILTLALQGSLSGLWAILGVLLYISFFELGLGCIPFFLASEMIHAEYAGTVQSMAMSFNWLSNFIVGLGFPYLDKYLGAWAFVPFAMVLLATTIYALRVLPESRGFSPDQVRQAIQQGQTSATHRPILNQDQGNDAQYLSSAVREIV